MFQSKYHDKIPEDVSRLGTIEKLRVRKAIEEKLKLDPMIFSKPLQNSLRGFRSLRVGDYRIVFLLKKQEVFIIIICHRAEVYTLAGKRI